MSYQDYRTRVPQYTDISHFRAPYKNTYMAGFGLSLSGDIVTQNDKGYLVVNDAYKDKLSEILKSHTVAPLSVQGAVSGGLLSTNPAGGENASSWVSNQVSDGNVVFITPATLTLMMNLSQSGMPYPPGVDYLWTLESSTTEAKKAAKGAVVLAGNPDKKPMSVGLIALLVGGTAAAAFLIVGKMKK